MVAPRMHIAHAEVRDRHGGSDANNRNQRRRKH
jgi:hypothetical protein